MLRKFIVAFFIISLTTLGIAVGASASFFPTTIVLNTTGADDSKFTGAPDDTFWGLGGQTVVFDFGLHVILDGSGQDFNVYEADRGDLEFTKIDVFVSQDNVNWFQVDDSEADGVRIPGDEVHSVDRYFKSYDLSITGLAWARYLKIDGVGTGSAGGTAAFDLDAVGPSTTRCPCPARPCSWAPGFSALSACGEGKPDQQIRF